MKRFSVTIEGRASHVTGIKDQSALSLELKTCDGPEHSRLTVSAVRPFKDGLHAWDFPVLYPGDRITIELLSDGEADPPSRFVAPVMPFTDEEKAALRANDERLVRMIEKFHRASAAGEIPERKDESELACSFCGKLQGEVAKLLAGPDANVCIECVSLCAGIFAEEVDE